MIRVVGLSFGFSVPSPFVLVISYSSRDRGRKGRRQFFSYFSVVWSSVACSSEGLCTSHCKCEEKKSEFDLLRLSDAPGGATGRLPISSAPGCICLPYISEMVRRLCPVMCSQAMKWQEPRCNSHISTPALFRIWRNKCPALYGCQWSWGDHRDLLP